MRADSGETALVKGVDVQGVEYPKGGVPFVLGGGAVQPSGGEAWVPMGAIVGA